MDNWRLPTIEETKSLLDTDKVKSEFVVQNSVSGRLFTDKATNNSMFLPASDYYKITYCNHDPKDINLSALRNVDPAEQPKDLNNETLRWYCRSASYHGYNSNKGSPHRAEECFDVFDRSCGYAVRPVAKRHA